MRQASVALAITLSFLAPGVAHAAPSTSPPGEQGPGIAPGYDPAAFNARYGSPEKQRLAAEAAEARQSGDKDAIERFIAHDEEYLSGLGIDFSTIEPQVRENLEGSTAVLGRAPGGGDFRAASNPLYYSYQYAESPDYYCGPATALQIVATHGDWYAAANSAPASEPNMAYLLSTTTSGTSWYPYHMGPTLNWWELGSTTGYYVAVAAPSYTTMYSDVSYDIDNLHEAAIDIHESAGGFHLVGHPTYHEIYHWASLDGYNGYGQLRLVDPVYGSSISYAGGTTPYAWYNSSDLASMFDGTYGIVW